MATRKEKLEFDVKRFLNFTKGLLTDRRGVVGVGIIVFFIVLALTAPVLSPHDPYYDEYLAGDYAAPTWLRVLPGGGRFSENQLVVNQSVSDFDTADALDEWKITVSDPGAQVMYCSNFGEPYGGPGSVVVEYYRRIGETPRIIEVAFERDFSFTYPASPKRFTFNYSQFLSGVEGLQEVSTQAAIRRVNNRMNISADELTADPGLVDGYTSDGYQFKLYALKTTKFASSMTYWDQPTDVDSYSSAVRGLFTKAGQDPAAVVFNGTLSDRYTCVLRLTIVDTDPTKNVHYFTFIDGLNLRLLGNSFGLLGTDGLGRDIFTQLVYGTRISLMVGMLSAFLGVVLGLFVGVVAGYVGSIVDELLMRFTDMLLVLPNLPLLLVLIAVLGPSTLNIILLIGVLGWMGFARVVRSQTLSLKERPFVEAAKAVGARKFYIIVRHIVPNVMSLVYVTLALSVPGAIIAEAALSFLGLFDPKVMSWGRMLYDSMAVERSVDKWWWVVPPGIFIAILSLSFIMIGYAIDDVLNPKLRQRR